MYLLNSYTRGKMWHKFNFKLSIAAFFNWLIGLMSRVFTLVQSQVALYQRFLKWYLIPLCLTLTNIRYVSRVKWSNPGKGVVPSLTPQYSSYWKGSLLVTLDFYSCFEFRVFLLLDPLLLPKLKNPNCPSIYPLQGREEINPYLSQVQSEMQTVLYRLLISFPAISIFL